MSHIFGPNIVTSGLVLYLDAGNTKSYPGLGTTWTDLSGNSINGTLTNGPAYDSANLGSVSLDGVDDYVDGSSPVTGNTNATMLGFVNVTLNKKGAFFRNGINGNGYAIGIGSGSFDSNGDNIIMLFPGSRWMGSSYTWNSGWQMVTMTLDSNGTPSAYKNDSFIFSSAGGLAGSAQPYYQIGRNIGDEPAGPRAAQCKIGNFMMYNRALTLTEITQNYNALKSRYGL